MGTGKKNSQLLIVGEAPGQREDEEHAAFVGPAGALLTELLEEAGFSRSDCYITNAVKCRPADNATPTRLNVRACSDFLAKEIDKVQPKLILGLGNTALLALTRRSGITKHRGKLYSAQGIPVICTFHPAAALRSAGYLHPIRADLQAAARRLNGGSTLRTRTVLVTNKVHLKSLIRVLERADTIAFDLETSGLHEWADDAAIVTLGVSWGEGRSAVIPLWHSCIPQDQFAANWITTVLHELKPVLEDKTKKYVAHNGKFDCKWLARFGVYVPLTFDTMIAAHLLDENRSKGLKPLAQMLLGADDWDEEVKSAYSLPIKRLAIYNGKDCDYTLRLYYIFRKELLEQPRVARVFQKLMMPASAVFTRLELGGTYLDEERLEDRYIEATRNVEKLERYMLKSVPKKLQPINFNSPAQVSVWLFKSLKLPILEETKTGAPSTAESVLFRLEKKHKVVSALLKYRKWSKYLSTYLGPWIERRDKRGRIHPSYRLTGTVTGRLSSSEPNLQQVPRNSLIRGCIGAPPGWTFMEADYSQIELRIAAWMAGERSMLRLLNSGHDLHRNTAMAITGKDDIDGEDRVIWGKHPNFGLLFGMYPKKYQEYCRDNGGQEITLATAEEVYQTFHNTYPALRRWHSRQIRLAHRYLSISNPIGRVRHLPDVRNPNDSVRMEAERQAINSPVQGFASDLMVFSAIRLARIFDGRYARMVGSVHDSLLFEVRDEMVDEVARTVKDVMEDKDDLKKMFGVKLEVPIVVEISVGQFWSESETWTDEKHV